MPDFLSDLEPPRLVASERAGDNASALSVSEIAGLLKRHVETGFSHVRIRGEISGYKRAASGHIYLTLKDDAACIDGVLWKTGAGRLAFVPADGVEVIATGKLTTYPGRSKYQIVIETMEIAGEGALLALLEKLKARLAGEGLFAAERKKPLPFLPHKIGVVTSPTGAVIRDILHRIEDRCPTEVVVWPVLVQGQSAGAQVAAAIAGFCAMPEGKRPDLLIVARGGGSIEDLWGFNDEGVVRAVANACIPLISAVGHETDTTLCDFAADARAPTPTAAAEMAVPVRADLLAGLQTLEARALRAVRRYADRARERMTSTARRLPPLEALLGPQRQRADDYADRLRRAALNRLIFARGELAQTSAYLRPASLSQKLANSQDRLNQLWRVAQSLNPDNILDRGYARITRRDGATLTSAKAARGAGALTLRFADGSIDARVERAAAPAYDRPKPEQPSLL